VWYNNSIMEVLYAIGHIDTAWSDNLPYFGMLIEWLKVVPAVLISLTFHEFCHGYVAYLLGDPTAKNANRLTLNPLKHIDPVGLICMIVARFGWAKPVPVNMYYFKNPKRDMAIVAFAGPLSNLLLGLICVFAYYALMLYMPTSAFFTAMSEFIALVAIISVGFAVFNLIPLPPLDGSRILALVIPNHFYYKLMQYEHYIQLGFMLLLFLGVLTVPLGYARSFVMGGIERFVRWIML